MNPPSSNRRRARRRPPRKTVKLQCRKGPWGIGPNVARSLLDLSLDGVRLVIASAVENGQEVTVSLEGPWHKQPVVAQGRVRWCMPLPDGAFCIGVHFDKTLPYQEVQDLSAINDG